MMGGILDRVSKFGSKGYQSARGAGQYAGTQARNAASYNATAQHASLLDSKVKIFCAANGYSVTEVAPMLAFARAADRINRKHAGSTMVSEWTQLVNQCVGRGMIFADLWLLIKTLFGYSYVVPPVFQLSVNIAAPGGTFTIPLQNDGGTYAFSVDYGDGSPVLPVVAWNDVNLTHVYAAAGVYTVTMQGVCTRLTFVGSPERLKVLALVDCYDMGFTELSFTSCSNMTAVSANLSKLASLTTAAYMFYGCSALPVVSSVIFSGSVGITTFEACFKDSGLTVIPAGLFDSNVNAVEFGYVFSNTPVAAIPVGIFDKNILATGFSYAFSQCASLADIQSGIFDKNVLATNFSYTFAYCAIAASIPANLFKFNVLATNFTYTFLGCAAITVIPAGTFDFNVNVTTFKGVFRGCVALLGTPSQLFTYCVLATDFTEAFKDCSSSTNFVEVCSGCTGLTTVDNMFAGCGAVTSMVSAFYNCTSLLVIPAGFLGSCVLLENVSNMFRKCSGLTAIPALVFDLNIELTNVHNVFAECTGINTDIPGDMFQNCPDIDDFSYAFWNDASMTGGGWADIILDAVLPPSSTDGCFEGCVALAGFGGIPAAWK